MPRDTRKDIFGNLPKKSRTAPARQRAACRWLMLGHGCIAFIAD
ncbi:MAG: hypothetical protein ACKO85_08205 [Isosphaeraceae bacterium]